MIENIKILNLKDGDVVYYKLGFEVKNKTKKYTEEFMKELTENFKKVFPNNKIIVGTGELTVIREGEL